MFFAIGLFAFSAFQLLLRASYAMQDTRTPALVNVAAVAVNVLVDLLFFFVLDLGVPGLALGHAVSYVFASIVLLADPRAHRRDRRPARSCARSGGSSWPASRRRRWRGSSRGASASGSGRRRSARRRSRCSARWWRGSPCSSRPRRRCGSRRSRWCGGRWPREVAGMSVRAGRRSETSEGWSASSSLLWLLLGALLVVVAIDAGSILLLRGRGRPISPGTRSVSAAEAFAESRDEEQAKLAALETIADSDEPVRLQADRGRRGEVTVEVSASGRHDRGGAGPVPRRPRDGDGHAARPRRRATERTPSQRRERGWRA